MEPKIESKKKDVLINIMKKLLPSAPENFKVEISGNDTNKRVSATLSWEPPTHSGYSKNGRTICNILGYEIAYQLPKKSKDDLGNISFGNISTESVLGSNRKKVTLRWLKVIDPQVDGNKLFITKPNVPYVPGIIFHIRARNENGAGAYASVTVKPPRKRTSASN